MQALWQFGAEACEVAGGQEMEEDGGNEVAGGVEVAHLAIDIVLHGAADTIVEPRSEENLDIGLPGGHGDDGQDTDSLLIDG